METNSKETFKKVVSWLRAIFIIFGFFYMVINSWGDKYPDRLEDYTKNKFFDGVLVEKYKDKDRNYFLFLNIKDFKGNVENIHISEGNYMDGLLDFYDYLQVGDTLLKEKGSRQIIVKNGTRSRIFEAKERDAEE
jgi:hypothetical protein